MPRLEIHYPSYTELAPQYNIASTTGVVNAETDAITLKPVDVDTVGTAEPASNTQATLYINFTMGSLTNCLIKIYGSYLANPTSGDWYQETIESDSTGVATLDKQIITLTATTKVSYHIPLGAYKALKITVGSTGTITNSAIKLNLGLRTN